MTVIRSGGADRARGAGAPSAGLARTVQVETPEQVALGFELADLGSRFLALVLDGVLLALLLGGLVGLALFVRERFEPTGVLAAWGLAALVLTLFTVFWGYFAFFEGLREGQTPGKRRTGIRVIHEGGHPLTLRGAAIRNLVRLVDVQPGMTSLVGGLTMMLHPRTQRLGDLAAGTLVVRDRGEGRLPEEVWGGEATGPPRLDDREFTALDRLVARADGLAEEPRQRLVAQLAGLLARHLPAAAPGGSELERLRVLHAEESQRRARRGGSGTASPQAAALFRARRTRWAEYEALVEEARRRGLQGLDEDRVTRFAALYRLVAADLARVRTYRGSQELAYRLERLVGAGHNLFYRPPERSWAMLRAWLASGFPRLVRRRRAVVAAAALALFLPAVATYTTVRREPGVARSLLPAEVVASAELAPERLARGQGYIDPPEVFASAMSSGLIANNVQVTFLAFAGGVLAGLGTVALLVFNGVFLGAVVALYDAEGAGSLIWGFVAAHGVIELTAIAIAGGAGMWMGSGLVLPGRLQRSEAFTRRALEGVSLLAGTSLLLVLAGLVEGFISPAPIPTAVRLGAALSLAVALAVYLILGGRHAGEEGAARPGPAPGRRTPTAERTEGRLRTSPGTWPPGSG